MAARHRTPLPDTDVHVVRLIGKTGQGRLAYAADAVVDGDLEEARRRAAERLAGVLRSPLGLWPPSGPDTEVWVTETVERGSPDDGSVEVMVRAEFAAVVDDLGTTPIDGQHHRFS